MQPENNTLNEPSVPVVENTGSDVVSRDKPKKNLGVILGMVFLAILAAGGIGFGVWAMMDGNSQVAKKDEQIADLRSQLAEKNQTVVEEDMTVEVETGDNTEASINTADYIYVGEWGLKIKKPSSVIVDGKAQDGSIAAVDYAFDGSRLYIWGTVYREGDQAAMGGYLYALNDRIVPPYLVMLERASMDSCLKGEKIGELNGDILCYIESDSGVLGEAFGNDVMDRYVKPTMAILKDSFANMDNYQKI
ncbi:hypothetical protein IJI28_01665 [Candidatus Saccharibacteria bacterium]|nr:hypothetical protein [Candidatus Saccharibacteria bacterium]